MTKIERANLNKKIFIIMSWTVWEIILYYILRLILLFLRKVILILKKSFYNQNNEIEYFQLCELKVFSTFNF